MSARILIVEDAPPNILALTSILKEHGYKVSVATNGRPALEVLDRVSPDLILLVDHAEPNSGVLVAEEQPLSLAAPQAMAFSHRSKSERMALG